MGFGKCRTLAESGDRSKGRDSDLRFGDGRERFRLRLHRRETSLPFLARFERRGGAERFSISSISVSGLGFEVGFGFRWWRWERFEWNYSDRVSCRVRVSGSFEDGSGFWMVEMRFELAHWLIRLALVWLPLYSRTSGSSGGGCGCCRVMVGLSLR
jgi:hypothetical protein